MKNYTIPDSNSLYYLWVGFVSILKKNILFQPKYRKEKFQKHTKTMLERYVLTVPSIEFRNIDWGDSFASISIASGVLFVNIYNSVDSEDLCPMLSQVSNSQL